jgi:hypothetical protein
MAPRPEHTKVTFGDGDGAPDGPDGPDGPDAITLAPQRICGPG